MFLALLLLSIVQPGALSTREFDILGGLSINPRLTRPHYYVIDHDGYEKNAKKFRDGKNAAYLHGPANLTIRYGPTLLVTNLAKSAR